MMAKWLKRQARQRDPWRELVGGAGGIWAQQLVGGLSEPRALSEPLLNW